MDLPVAQRERPEVSVPRDSTFNLQPTQISVGVATGSHDTVHQNATRIAFFDPGKVHPCVRRQRLRHICLHVIGIITHQNLRVALNQMKAAAVGALA